MDHSPPRAKHILLADDDDDDRLLFTEVLEEISLDAQVTAAHDGDHLMKILQSSNALPDVVFLDLNMPMKNGIECLEEIRLNERFKNLPVVILSTSAYPGTIERAFEIGAHLYVRKPSDFDSLKNVIQRALSIDWEHAQRPAIRDFVLTA